MFRRFLDRLWLLDADDGVGSGGASSGGSGDPNAAGGDSAANGTPLDSRTFTQAELDKIIGDRLKRERKDWETKLEDEKKKAAMTEADKLKAEREEADKHAAAKTEAANKRIITAEAKLALQAAGIKPERIPAALKLADLSSVIVGDDGEPDAGAIKAAVARVSKDFPEIITGGRMPKAGGDFSKAHPGEKPLSEEIIGRMSTSELKRRLPEVRAFYSRK